ncbi:MAG: fimbria major subunit, partial [Muribaculaceae bacterium]|nr:fimbria major subunit [Muribaculaceae bacterium]
PNIPESEDGYYMKVAFNMPAGTRSATDQYDTQIENAAFLFYDVNGNYYATRYIGNKAAHELDDENINWVTTDHPADKCAVIKLTKVPQYVVCVVNANKDRTFGSGIDGNTVTTVAKTGTNHLFMSSQTYYTGNNNSTTSYKSVIDIEKMIKTTQEAAEAAQGDEALIINVEPICAKVGVTKDENFKATPTAKNQFDEGVTITFTPEVVGLTGWNTQGYTIKKLPAYSGVSDALKNWNGFLDEDTGVSGWVGGTAGTVEYHSLDQMFENGTLKSNLRYAGAFGTQFFYPFENWSDDAVGRTNLFVLGKYTLPEGMAAADGTFYLLGVGDKFTIYKDEKELITKMGGDPEKDTLVEDCTTAGNHKTWTGWMKLSTTNSAFKCVKYNGGYGYYAHEILRVKELNEAAIVRNTWYKLNVKTIEGMGVGIPEKDTPIIPVTPPDPNQQTYYMHIAVDVQPWVELSKYDVEWK